MFTNGKNCSLPAKKTHFVQIDKKVFVVLIFSLLLKKHMDRYQLPCISYYPHDALWHLKRKTQQKHKKYMIYKLTMRRSKICNYIFVQEALSID